MIDGPRTVSSCRSEPDEYVVVADSALPPSPVLLLIDLGLWSDLEMGGEFDSAEPTMIIDFASSTSRSGLAPRPFEPVALPPARGESASSPVDRSLPSPALRIDPSRGRWWCGGCRFASSVPLAPLVLVPHAIDAPRLSSSETTMRM